ncbi:phage tail assembly chaperone [Convivina intestini]|uniref:phage tail assembly chaperone n=1 Tax=Convivina intestini TaxID=1505726 RepID=UPI00200C3EEF|nr:phage tail assembly chaperone [Convivina intestini]CAH1857505.1 hypothetical protein R077811_01539 [Convivina intestini]
MSVKIDVKNMLGTTKKVEVKTTTKNFKKAITFLRDMNHIQLEQMRNEKDSQDIEDSDSITALELNDRNMSSMLAMTDTVTNYIQSTLKLDEAQMEKLDEEHSLDEVMNFAMEIATKVTGSESEQGGEKDTLKV